MTGDVFLHARDLAGNVTSTVEGNPSVPFTRVPSLGQLTNRILDGFGFSTATIVSLHTAYLGARQFEVEDDARVSFILGMRREGMPHMVAAAFWEMMKDEHADVDTSYRNRYILDNQ